MVHLCVRTRRSGVLCVEMSRKSEARKSDVGEGQLETTHANAYRVGHYHTKHRNFQTSEFRLRNENFVCEYRFKDTGGSRDTIPVRLKMHF